MDRIDRYLAFEDELEKIAQTQAMMPMMHPGQQQMQAYQQQEDDRAARRTGAAAAGISAISQGIKGHKKASRKPERRQAALDSWREAGEHNKGVVKDKGAILRDKNKYQKAKEKRKAFEQSTDSGKRLARPSNVSPTLYSKETLKTMDPAARRMAKNKQQALDSNKNRAFTPDRVKRRERLKALESARKQTLKDTKSSQKTKSRIRSGVGGYAKTWAKQKFNVDRPKKGPLAESLSTAGSVAGKAFNAIGSEATGKAYRQGAALSNAVRSLR